MQANVFLVSHGIYMTDKTDVWEEDSSFSTRKVCEDTLPLRIMRHRKTEQELTIRAARESCKIAGSHAK